MPIYNPLTASPLEMLQTRHMRIRASILLTCLALVVQEETTANQGEAAVFGVFAGSTPCDDSIRQLLQIPAGVAADLIQWQLTLRNEPKTLAAACYELHCKYGQGATAKTVERQGRWRITKGAKSNPGATVYELDGGPSLLRVDDSVLHVLNRDGSLMVGGGGWSYTLYR